MTIETPEFQGTHLWNRLCWAKDKLEMVRTEYCVVWEDPEIKEQLDLLYKDMLADKDDKTGAWFAAVKAVKDKYPKE
jgi:hypothetical protein